MSDLDELLARVERATGLSRELDAAITVATTLTRKTDDDLIYLKLPHKADKCAAGTYWLVQRSGMSLQTSEPLTSSIDAAIGLVERTLGHAAFLIVHIDIGGAMSAASLELVETKTTFRSGEVRTPPLAILSAILRALNHKEIKK